MQKFISYVEFLEVDFLTQVVYIVHYQEYMYLSSYFVPTVPGLHVSLL